MTNEDFEKDCIESCKDIAEAIEAYANKEVYRCPECGGTIFWHDDEYDEDKDEYTCPHCNRAFSEDSLEALYVGDYFDEYFDVEYRIDERKRYRSVEVMVACGGPNIYVDTARKGVFLYWGFTQTKWNLTYNACDKIDDFFEEMYMCA